MTVQIAHAQPPLPACIVLTNYLHIIGEKFYLQQSRASEDRGFFIVVVIVVVSV